MFFLAFLASVEIVSKIWHSAPNFFFLPSLCNFSIQTYLWFGLQQIYIPVFSDQLYVTVMSNMRGRRALNSAFFFGVREGIAENDFGRKSVNFTIRAELLHFLIPPGKVMLVLAFTDEPKQTWVLAIADGM